MKTIFSPEDAKKEHIGYIPDYVFQAFNELLSENYNDTEIRICIDDVIDRIHKIQIHNDSYDYLTRQEIIDKHWMDIEPFYEDKGWDVTYSNSPKDNNEFYIFKPKNDF